MQQQKNNKTLSALLEGPGPKTLKETFVLYVKGLCMGIADLIPGVSGGTIAFITGIYEELLAAIASIRLSAIKNLFLFRWKEALTELHLKFILILAFGIFTSIILFSRVMHFLINVHPIPTWGFFLGLIIASILILFKELDNIKSAKSIFFLSFGTVFAYCLVSLIPVATPDAPWFIFICGLIGISAMILPGISGSFLLLILGKYEFITASLKNPFAADNFVTLIIFLAGTLTGLMTVAKLLNYFLTKFRASSMAFLTGVMIGSLKKIWPWKQTLESRLIRGKMKIIREENTYPAHFDSEFYLTIGLILFAFFIVYFLEKQGAAKNKPVPMN